jgi:hypothetical protein
MSRRGADKLRAERDVPNGDHNEPDQEQRTTEDDHCLDHRLPPAFDYRGTGTPGPKSACPEITALWGQGFWVRNADNSIRIAA